MQLTRLLPAFLLLFGSTRCEGGGESPSQADIKSCSPKCKCVYGEECWPSDLEWKTLDHIVGGNLIKTRPVAESCYPGPAEDLDECAYVSKMWTDQDFQSSSPVGRPYPYNITCPPVDYNAGEKPGACSLGSLPTYAVNATARSQIMETIRFARLHNIRLAVTGTGHDLLGRSDGYSALELWLHSFKNDINFQKTYSSINDCSKSGWQGSAIRIDGNYQWRDVYDVARENNVIAVGGGSITPGAIGGWSSGGGHGPATRNYGLGADQILEAEMMLADGRIVVANHCENTDLFKAMRGGGPGYGITLTSTVKAYPNVDKVTAHHFAMAPLHKTELNEDLLDAVAILLQSMPHLNDGGFAGYGYWFRNFATKFVGNATSGYTHGIWAIGKTQNEAEKVWKPVREALSAYSDKLFFNESWAVYDDYWSFYDAESGLYDPTGSTSVLTSRLYDRESLKDYKKVRETIEITSGKPGAYDSSVILLCSGGKVFEDASDTTSGLNPAWRKSHFAIVSGASIPLVPTLQQRQAANYEVTYVKGVAATKLAPHTGGYMNEGDRNDPDFKRNFYGERYDDHLRAKHKYDPFSVFYCPTCVGSDAFIERPDGPLCRA